MSLILLFLPTGSVVPQAKLVHSKVPIISGHQYELTFFVQSSQAQNITTVIDNSSEDNKSLQQTKHIPANNFVQLKFNFSGVETDSLSKLIITLAAGIQTTYFDKFKLIDLTANTRQYRLMRIQGSLKPGGFIQTLTLREKTAAETA